MFPNHSLRNARSLSLAFFLILSVIFSALPPATAFAAPETANAETSLDSYADSYEASSYNGYHYVKRGDTLTKIARWYGTTVWAIMKANGLSNPNHIYVGQRLHIPGSSYGSPGYGCARYHYVQHGQTLSHIAVYYGVNVHTLAQANGIYNLNHVYTGQRLCIPGGYAPKPHPQPQPQPPANAHYVYYQVKHGDTLYKIAVKFGTSTWHLVQINNLPNQNHIYVGQHLKVPIAYNPQPHPTAAPPYPTATPTHPPVNHSYWNGAYYNNATLSGAPLYVSQDGDINFSWGNGGPGGGIGNDNFSISWTRTLYFSPGTYRFFATADDGVRVYVDDQLVIDGWREQPPTNYFGDIGLGAGNHTVRIEYFEGGGNAEIYVRWGKL